MVISIDSAAGSGIPNSVQLALQPVKGSASPGIQNLIRHCNVFGEWWVFVVGKDVLEHKLDVAVLIISRYLLVGKI